MARLRRLTALLALAAGLAAQEPKPVDPPEEDENAKPKEYSFNPLQAAQEMKVGAFYAKKRNWKAAALRFEEAVKWDPNHAEGWLRLGEVRQKMDDAKGAREAWTKYIELAPDTGDARRIRKQLSKSSS